MSFPFISLLPAIYMWPMGQHKLVTCPPNLCQQRFQIITVTFLRNPLDTFRNKHTITDKLFTLQRQKENRIMMSFVC